MGFDPKKLGKLWNKLANAALHIRIPKDTSDKLQRYGDPEKIREAVLDALAEIERIDAGTLTSGGIGAYYVLRMFMRKAEQRRLALLKDRQIVNCINPKCYESYFYLSESEEFQKRIFPCAVFFRVTKKRLYPLGTSKKSLKSGPASVFAVNVDSET